MKASARAAGICYSAVYRKRDSDSWFREHWRKAVELGYDRVELRLLAESAPEVIEPADGDGSAAAGKPAPLDRELAFKLLKAHRHFGERTGRGAGERRERSFAEVAAAVTRALKVLRVRIEEGDA
ncbi:hypothetical protein HMF7854_12575 [Sphingomonas ginkgonis]|uniref:Uncharacterized protein n=1 Tax=Sphingomonas ginkgonis TaxID=2315330 RepID=A0A3S0ENG2_9SPHN|nr:hypothetical protein HMF7854_12575 [Sphingomonas ginkgonis]